MTDAVYQSEFEKIRSQHIGAAYLNPSDLAVTQRPLSRVAMVGSCLLECWGRNVPGHPDCKVDYFLVGALAQMPEWDGAEYDFQVLQIPLRAILPEPALWNLPYSATEAYEDLFEKTSRHLEWRLQRWMSWNVDRGLLTFVANFFTPQRNPLGNFLPKYDLRNPAFFVQKLNEHLEKTVLNYKNAYILDIDQISASIGRRNVQDDNTTIFAHASMIELYDGSEARIQKVPHIKEHYHIGELSVFRNAVWEEVKALHRSVMQTDSVKLVVVDLDDTLWRGVSGDMEDISVVMAEGWPIGVLEALAFLKQRGILLAIISKNEESRIHEIWPKIFRDKLPLDQFAAVRINWRPKVQNMQDILAGMNLLPRSVVFIDDNPAEREAMKSAFPDMRMLGRYPYYIRRTLLWAPETQVLSMSEESGRRTEMIKAQFKREETRSTMIEEHFLSSSSPKIVIFGIESIDHRRFNRVIELVNKTNQFNTTGHRWTIAEMHEFLQNGGHISAFEVTDSFADYGLVGVVLTKGAEIVQWVMSCRVLGCKIELAVMSKIVERIRTHQQGPVLGVLKKTDVNFPCRDLFSMCSFSRPADDHPDAPWTLPSETEIRLPDHITII